MRVCITPVIADEQRSCWDAPEKCISAQPSWLGRDNKTSRVEVTNHCIGRLYVKVCAEMNWISRYDNRHIVIKHHGDTLPNNEIKGIPFRIVEPQIEYSAHLTRMKNGQEDWTCDPSLLSRVIENTPSTAWYTVSYQPGYFEKHKFSVTLNDNGTLSSVNTESTPVGPRRP